MFEIPRAPSEKAMDAYAFRKWLNPELPDEERTWSLMLLKAAVAEELTPTQREYATEYYVRQKLVREIAAERGIDRSTVSRTLSRARKRLYKILRYTSRSALNDAFGDKANLIGIKRR